MRAHSPLDFFFLLFEPLPDLVLIRNYAHRQRPLQTQPGIVVQQAPLRTGGVELADLIARFGVISQHLVAVSETFVNVKGAAVFLGQFSRSVLEILPALSPPAYTHV